MRGPIRLALIRSRPYAILLVVAAAIGAPIAVAAYFFLKLTELTQQWVFTDLPSDLGSPRSRRGGRSSHSPWRDSWSASSSGSCMAAAVRHRSKGSTRAAPPSL